jgi:hypothetical protein
MGVKIISPSKNTTVAAGQLIIHGISSDTPKINCRVFVDWNDLKPMQNVTAKGPGGANDSRQDGHYSNVIIANFPCHALCQAHDSKFTCAIY